MRGSASTAPSYCTWLKACSTITFRPTGKACRRSGLSAATTGPAGATPEPLEQWSYILAFSSMGDFTDAVDQAFHNAQRTNG